MTKGNTITIYKYLMGVNFSEEEGLFSVVKGLLWPTAIRLNWTKQSINWIPSIIPSRLQAQLPRDSAEGTSGSFEALQGAQQRLLSLHGNAVPWTVCLFSLLCPHPRCPVSTWVHTQPSKKGRKCQRKKGWFSLSSSASCTRFVLLL